MDRRIAGAQTARRIKMQKRFIAAAFEFDDAWATVNFTEGRGFRISGLYETKPVAEENAQRENLTASDASYLANAPYSVVFTAPVERPPSAKKYKRGVFYYASLRKDTDGYCVFLHVEESPPHSEKPATAIGGPVFLPQPRLIRPALKLVSAE